jgi:phi LC3 family holin
MINIKVRFRNPVFIAQLILAVLTPILAYAGLTMQDLTTWKALGDLLLGAVKNPYVLSLVVVSVFNAVTDPTTAGVKDSERALTYDFPHRKEVDNESIE